MSKPFTYGQLYRLFLALGFEDISDPPKYAGFRHQESNTQFLLPVDPLDEPVPQHHLVGVRRILDEKRLLDGKDYDRIVAQGRIPKSLNARTTAR